MHIRTRIYVYKGRWGVCDGLLKRVQGKKYAGGQRMMSK